MRLVAKEGLGEMSTVAMCTYMFVNKSTHTYKHRYKALLH